MNLDVISNREAILTACEHVRTSQEECPWVVIGYSEFSPHPDVLTIDISTNGTTWKDFLLALHVDKTLYAYLKLDAAIVDKRITPQTQFVLIFIHWTGGSVPVNEKSICSRHTEKICDLLGEYHCKLMCSSVVDILTNIDVLNCKDSFLRFKASRVKPGEALEGNLIPSNHARITVNVLGDPGCGKSSFVAFLKSERFDPYRLVTTGIEFSRIECYNNEIKFKINIWDNSGLDLRRPSVTYVCNVKRTNGIILFYDITNRDTFVNIRERMVLVKKYTSPSTCIMLLGNKTDLGNHRKVTIEEGEELARELGINLFFEISVRNRTNLMVAWKAFNLLVGINFNRDIAQNQGLENTIELGRNNTTPQRNPCCK